MSKFDFIIPLFDQYYHNEPYALVISIRIYKHFVIFLKFISVSALFINIF